MVGVQVDTGRCGSCNVSTQDCVVGVLVDPGLCGGCTDSEAIQNDNLADQKNKSSGIIWYISGRLDKNNPW